jgi:proteasome beta subunit
MTRRIFPVIAVVTEAGFSRLPEDEVADIADAVVAARMQRPDGPAAPLT